MRETPRKGYDTRVDGHLRPATPHLDCSPIGHRRAVVIDSGMEPEFTVIQPDRRFDDLPAGARGTILDAYPATETYTIEFFEPERCVRTVPMHIVAGGTFPTGLTKGELSAWIRERFGIGG
jgi:hypothetical protein